MNNYPATSEKTFDNFLARYGSELDHPLAEYDGETIGFPNHILSGYIYDDLEKRYVIVRTADHDADRINKRQKLEQFFLVTTYDLHSQEEVIYDVSTDISQEKDPHRERVGTYLGAVAVHLYREGKYAATLQMESHDIKWLEPYRHCTFHQVS